jgi:ketosteroid isomerase-like protein
VSQENLDVVSRSISAINERDVEAYLAHCAADVELINPASGVEGPFRGEQGIRRFFEGIEESTTRFELEVERLQPIDDKRVLVFLVLHFESERGFLQTQPLTTLYGLDGGRLSRITVFADRDQALSAAGLRQ